jgi:hypothetical protein
MEAIASEADDVLCMAVGGTNEAGLSVKSTHPAKYLRLTAMFSAVIEQGVFGYTTALDYLPDRTLQLRRVKPRLDFAFEVKRNQARLLSKDGFGQIAVCVNALIDVHLEPAEHDRDEACWQLVCRITNEKFTHPPVLVPPIRSNTSHGFT